MPITITFCYQCENIEFSLVWALNRSNCYSADQKRDTDGLMGTDGLSCWSHNSSPGSDTEQVSPPGLLVLLGWIYLVSLLTALYPALASELVLRVSNFVCHLEVIAGAVLVFDTPVLLFADPSQVYITGNETGQASNTMISSET